MAQRFDLDRKIKELSKGNQQKVGVIQAFMHKPSVLILDEPTSGLDPIVQREFSALVDETQSRGAAILLSSHVLSEVHGIKDVQASGNRVTCTVIGAETELLRVAVEHGLDSVQTHESNLDEIFFSIVEGGDLNGFSTPS